MTKQEALVRLNGLSPVELEEFVQQRELFHRAAFQRMAEVHERHASLIQVGRMNEHFQLIDPPILL